MKRYLLTDRGNQKTILQFDTLDEAREWLTNERADDEGLEDYALYEIEVVKEFKPIVRNEKILFKKVEVA